MPTDQGPNEHPPAALMPADEVEELVAELGQKIEDHLASLRGEGPE